MKIQKIFMSITIILQLLCAFYNAIGQNANFSILPDSAIAGSRLNLVNNSTGFSDVNYVWTFYNARTFYTHPISFASYSDTTTNQSDTIKLTYDYAGNYIIKLAVYDSNWALLDTIDNRLYIYNKNFGCDNSNPGPCDYLCNGGFEILYNGLPTDWRLLWHADGWCYPETTALAFGCADLFHVNAACTGNCTQYSNPQAPTNFAGFQVPFNNGKAYAGVACYQYESPGYREYAQTGLRSPLILGRKYYVGMRISLAENSAFYIDTIGMSFTVEKPKQLAAPVQPPDYYPGNIFKLGSSGSSIKLKPQVFSKYVADYDWVLVSDTIIGNGENWITIGNFSNDLQSNPQLYAPNNVMDPSHQHLSYYYIDSVFVIPIYHKSSTLDTACLGGTWQMESSVPYSENVIYSWSNGSIDPSITVNVTGNATYICTATDYTNMYFICPIIDTFNIVAYQNPSPIITGNNNNCDAEVTYTVSNSNPNYTYAWSIADETYGNIQDPNSSTVTVFWDQSSNHFNNKHTAYFTWLIAEITDTHTGCTSKDSIKIWKCCRNSDYPPINDTVVTGTAIFNNNVVFNGDIVINQTITIHPTDTIRMGPEARFIVNPPYTFKVYSSHIKNGCNYMWDGIYIKDSNAVFADSASGTIQNALNAVVSENGGKFRLKNIKFYNNYTSVLVSKYFNFFSLPTHKGKIYGCTFAKSGTGMIAPYLNIKPRHGIYLDNVYNITIGDSTQTANIFRNVFCGIASYNSSANVFKNDFRNIKIPVLCQGGPVGDYTGLYCETAIHSVSTSSDRDHYNESQLKSGAGINSRNTFDTCSTAIYTYTTLTTVNSNKVKNTGTGIYCREATTGSFVINSAFKTNTSTAIKFLYVLPVTRKITIKYDSILDPVYGIYISNDNSHATLPMLKSIIRNNYISLNRAGVCYGIKVENSNFIQAYCNNINRSSTITLVDSLKNVGIQVAHCASAEIHDNTLSNLGLGIKCSGNLSGARLLSNTFSRSYHGFYFETAYSGNSTVLTNQGANNVPSGNTFTEYPGKPNTYRFAGNLPQQQCLWYYNSGTTTNVVIPLWSLLNGKIIPLSTGGYPLYLNCGIQPQSQLEGVGLSNILSVETDAQTLNTSFSSSINFDVIDQPMKYMLKENAYRILNNMEQMPTQANQTLFQQYYSQYNQLKNGNTGKFDKVLRFAENGQLNAAKYTNKQINPDNEMEQNMQYANGVYFDYVLPQTEIPNTVVERLQLIADTPPCIGGEGVYTARAILGFTETLPETNKSLEKQNEENSAEGAVIVYPNPANDEVFILLDGYENGQKVEVELYNILGALIINKQVIISGEAISISTTKIPAGSYILVLKTESKTIYNGRLVIIK